MNDKIKEIIEEIAGEHNYYDAFLSYGDEESYRKNLKDLRKKSQK